MASHFERYKERLQHLIKMGEELYQDLLKNKKKASLFYSKYQIWYTEAYEVIKNILPGRLEEFKKYYHIEKKDKELTPVNYTIQDWLIGLRAPLDNFTPFTLRKFDEINCVILKFYNQLAILSSARLKFESVIYNLQEIVRADLFDSELEAARELLKNGFLRASGAIAGVVLEKHLKQVCINHRIKIRKKKPTISDYNDTLKENNIIDTPKWRNIQRLGDIRNLCVHERGREPTKEEVEELIKETEKITKTLF